MGIIECAKSGRHGRESGAGFRAQGDGSLWDLIGSSLYLVAFLTFLKRQCHFETSFLENTDLYNSPLLALTGNCCSFVVILASSITLVLVGRWRNSTRHLSLKPPLYIQILLPIQIFHSYDGSYEHWKPICHSLVCQGLANKIMSFLFPSPMRPMAGSNLQRSKHCRIFVTWRLSNLYPSVFVDETNDEEGKRMQWALEMQLLL